MATLKLEIVTPEKVVYSDNVDGVVIPGVEGEMGIYPMHIPLMTILLPGELVVTIGSKKLFLAIGEGFVTIDQTSVKVITDMAIESNEIDEAAVEAAVKRAEETMARKEDVSAEESATMQAILAKSLAQLKVKRRRNH
ncbi:MAG: ATP synthase F1 subunit epsilon [Verrucomicrobia bacterium]|jgi:F-type H+-transporting ATPase subunit epsilon|nr:ATP synthase F1 subunit epsilon [Verrucomicrobiota bacterium]